MICKKCGKKMSVARTIYKNYKDIPSRFRTYDCHNCKIKFNSYEFMLEELEQLQKKPEEKIIEVSKPSKKEIKGPLSEAYKKMRR